MCIKEIIIFKIFYNLSSDDSLLFDLDDSLYSSNCYSYCYVADNSNPGILVLVLVGVGYIAYCNYFDLVDNILSVKK